MCSGMTNYLCIKLRRDFKKLMEKYSSCAQSLEACYAVSTVLIDDMLSLGYSYDDIKLLMEGYVQEHQMYSKQNKNKIVYVYKEYNSQDAYTQERIEVFNDLFMARATLKYRVEKTFNKKWDDLKKDINSECDILTEDFAKINKNGHPIYFTVEGGFAV